MSSTRGTIAREPLFEAPIAGLGIVLLPGLVIFAAEDHDVIVPVRLDAKKVVGVSRVPPQRVGHHTASAHARRSRSWCTARASFETGWRRPMPAKPDQRIVRRDDDVLARHRMAIGLHRARVVAELVGLRVLVDPAPERHERLRHAREIPARMDAGLIRKADAWPVHQRHRLDVLRIEAQLTRQRRVGLAGASAASLVSSSERRVEVPVHPLEARVDVVLADDLVNRGDRGQPRVPDGLRMVASEPLSPAR